mgnify:CR=1 FL=1
MITINGVRTTVDKSSVSKIYGISTTADVASWTRDTFTPSISFKCLLIRTTVVYRTAAARPKRTPLASENFGRIGTNLTCDTNTPSLNIVMKLMQCRINANSPWVNCIKVSDDTGKVMGDETEIQQCFHDLNIEK